MTGKKRVETLNENISIRTVKLHFHRFGKFLRYLKQQNAVIELDAPGSTHQSGSHKLVYTANKRDGNPAIEDLVAEALNISESLAREYTSRKMGIDDRHSDGDKIYSTGRMIDAVSFYTGSNPIGEGPDLFSNPHAFKVRSADPFDSSFSYSKEATDPSTSFMDHPLHSCFRQFAVHVIMNLSDLYRRERALLYSVQHGSPFTIELQQLQYIYGDSVTPVREASAELIKNIQDLESYYYSFSEKKCMDYPFMADYLDFTIPCSSFHARQSTQQNIGDIVSFLRNPDHSLRDFIPYRYEILWALSTARFPVPDWPSECHALLLLSHAEHVSSQMMILDCVDFLLKGLTFIIFSGDEPDALNLQRDSLSLPELSDILTRYNFRNGLENSIEISGTNILNTSIYKYPEPHAAKGGYSKVMIQGIITRRLKNHLETRIRKDLYYPESDKRTFSSRMDF